MSIGRWMTPRHAMQRARGSRLVIVLGVRRLSVCVGIRSRDQGGSSLPELLVAAGLGVVALAVLATGLLGPVRSLELATRPDPRADQLDLARLELQRILRAARPGLDAPALRALDEHVLEARLGDLSRAEMVRITLADHALLIVDGTGTRVVPLPRVDLSRSHLRPITIEGVAVDPTRPDDAVAVHVVLHVHADEPDGEPDPAVRRHRQHPRGALRAEHVIGLRASRAIEEVLR